MYLVVANTGKEPVDWTTIKVQVPAGPGGDDLTSNITKIVPTVKYVPKSGTPPQVTVKRQDDVFHATGSAGSQFKRGDYMVLTLENVPVAPMAGVAVLMVTESSKTPSAKKTSDKFVPMALVKTAPKETPAPRNFRPEKSMVDAGTDVVLLWDGSNDFDYKIVLPDGAEEAASQGKWSPKAKTAPKRDATYILVATSRSTPTRKHFLTTTVQVRNPVLETVTADKAIVNGVTTPWVQGPNDNDGSISLSPGGLNVWRLRGSQDRGTVWAAKADVNGVNTEWVQGRNADDGWISFPKSGLNVYQNGSQNWGTVTADKGLFNSVTTLWAGGPNSGDGGITFPEGGVLVWRTVGRSEWGTVFADTAEANGVKTYKVVGKNADGGWITFPSGGMNVHQAHARWGVVGALRFGVRSND
ncbi:hypothetical protein ACIBO2_41980 [Nonomuraea sp. NPDC050022]|uniref:hypothetical protein n=1 Tax=Nonomuraea sp. NPDC050022 TaxID=3364358 RepID=UPI0037A6BEA7